MPPSPPSLILPRLLPASAVKAIRFALPVSVATMCITALLPQLSAVDLAAVRAVSGEISAVSWALALLATFASFWAIGQYDVVLHRHFATRVFMGLVICPSPVCRRLFLYIVAPVMLGSFCPPELILDLLDGFL